MENLTFEEAIKELEKTVDTLLEYSTVPVLVQPNAGLPKMKDGQTVYDVTPEEYSKYVCDFAKKGAAILGGCCGTTPEHIRKTVEKTKNLI